MDIMYEYQNPSFYIEFTSDHSALFCQPPRILFTYFNFRTSKHKMS